MHMYAHTCVKYSNTHACMHAHVCMHAQPMQAYILHHDLKIFKIKESDLYEKKRNKYIQVNEESFGYFYCLKLFESTYIYTHALLKSKQWISIYTSKRSIGENIWLGSSEQKGKRDKKQKKMILFYSERAKRERIFLSKFF